MYLNGLNNKVYRSGAIVTADAFPRGNAEKLVSEGFLTELDPSNPVELPPVLLPLLFLLEKEGEKPAEIRSADDLTIENLLHILETYSIDHHSDMEKPELWAILMESMSLGNPAIENYHLMPFVQISQMSVEHAARHQALYDLGYVLNLESNEFTRGSEDRVSADCLDLDDTAWDSFISAFKPVESATASGTALLDNLKDSLKKTDVLFSVVVDGKTIEVKTIDDISKAEIVKALKNIPNLKPDTAKNKETLFSALCEAMK